MSFKIPTFAEFLLESYGNKAVANDYKDVAKGDRKEGSWYHEMATFHNSLANYDLQSVSDNDIEASYNYNEISDGSSNSTDPFYIAKRLKCEPYQIASTPNKIYVLKKESTSAYKYLNEGKITKQLERVLNKFSKEVTAKDTNPDGSFTVYGSLLGYTLKQALGFNPDDRIYDYISRNAISSEESEKRYNTKNAKEYLTNPNTSKESKERFRESNKYGSPYNAPKGTFDIKNGDADYENGKEYGPYKADYDKGDWYSSPSNINPNNRVYLDNKARFASENYANAMRAYKKNKK